MNTILGDEKGNNPSPFVPTIRDYPYPENFKMPGKIPQYEGTTDPRDFLRHYLGAMEVPKASDEILCMAFAITFQGKARQWFDDLPRGSIRSFRELTTSFLQRFFQLKAMKKTVPDLMNIRQDKDESLSKYFARFNDESL